MAKNLSAPFLGFTFFSFFDKAFTSSTLLRVLTHDPFRYSRKPSLPKVKSARQRQKTYAERRKTEIFYIKISHLNRRYARKKAAMRMF